MPSEAPTDGGTAFPFDGNYRKSMGMTLRDYFAAQAMPKLLEMCAIDDVPQSIARSAYRIADAMLAEREK